MEHSLHDEGDSIAESPSIVPVVKSRRWDAAKLAFSQMQEESHLGQPDNLPVVHQVWTGYIGKLMEGLGFDRSKGTYVIRDLERMGCIEVKTRGKRGKLTEVVVVQPPTEAAFAALGDGLYMTSKKQEDFDAKQAERMSLIERVQWLEETMEIMMRELDRHINEDHA
jgi:hypothetical protein